MKTLYRESVALGALVTAIGLAGPAIATDPAAPATAISGPAPATISRSAGSGSLVDVAICRGPQSHPDLSQNGRPILPNFQNIDPFYGDIDPFHGDINPFYGDINPFYGDISPFWGDINPFWGDINPFHGDINPFWGDINPFSDGFHTGIAPFWQAVGPIWGDMDVAWENAGSYSASSAASYAQLRDDLQALLDRAETVFGERVEGVSGESFTQAFSDALLAKYGLDLQSPESLAQLDSRGRRAFFLEFYDGLMAYTLADRVDHWMGAINWSPELSRAAGGGKEVRIGLLDASMPANFDLQIDDRWGETGWLDFNHGFAVAGLIAARHDGKDVMGLAPEVKFTMYNPFDASLTAGWDDVRTGLRTLLDNDKQPDIVNLSLGVSGWTFHAEWASIFSDPQIAGLAPDTLFVVAAGNDGLSQSANVDWTHVDVLENLLIVGSVDANGNISNFSNRPGSACLTVGGACLDGHRLMDRFLVAPGELILVWNGEEGVDGNHGLTRMSGTSFAAPLVAGTAALVQGRWQWLEPYDVANVLLWSARDLGEPGVDPVYGWGLLDAGAAMSPLDPSNLFQWDGEGNAYMLNGAGIIAGVVDLDPSQEGYVVVFEALGETYRDFEIPLEEFLAATSGAQQEAAVAADAAAAMAERLHTRLPSGDFFVDSPTYERPVLQRGALRVSYTAAPHDPRHGHSESDLAFQAGVSIRDLQSGQFLRFGIGAGALALSAQPAFSLFSDHRPSDGGVNPVLGLASGGPYAAAGWRLPSGGQIHVGVTVTESERASTHPITGEEIRLIPELDAYSASAASVSLRQPLGPHAAINVAVTRLDEGSGLLGAQGFGHLSLDGGTETHAVTLGADIDLPGAITLSGSGSYGHTARAAFSGDVLALPDGAGSTAFQLTARRNGVLSRDDAVRISLIQPLHVEHGTLTYTAAHVVDRASGEIGMQTQRWGLGGTRTFDAELLYATPLWQGQGQFSFFARAEGLGAQGPDATPDVLGGLRFELDF